MISRHKAILLVAGFLIVVVIVAVSGVAASPSHQEPEFALFVTTTEDHNDGACDGDCSLREAIIAANQSQFDDIIWVPSGTYTLTLEGSGEDDALTGDLDIASSLAIVGDGAETTIIDAGGMTSDPDRVLHIDPAGSGAYEVNLWGLTITGGDVAEVNGGGIYNRDATMMLHSCIITGNSAHWGGGIWSTFGSMSGYNITVSSNSASSGGGIALGATPMNLYESTVSGNSGDLYGGGISSGFGTLRVENSTISGNSASFGGGISSGIGKLHVENSTISGNSAAADSGGGIRSIIGSTELYNTLVAMNPSGGDCRWESTDDILSLGYNLDSDNTCNLTAVGDLPDTDPRLGPLQDNGGPTFTHALLFGSPAMDTGDNSACPATDQRGFTRPMDGDGDGTATCDIGAFEHLGLRGRFPLVFSSYGPSP